MRSISDSYPYTAVRIEVRGEDFTLLSVHWSATLAHKAVGEPLARSEKAAACLARWNRIESDSDTQLKETS